MANLTFRLVSDHEPPTTALPLSAMDQPVAPVSLLEDVVPVPALEVASTRSQYVVFAASTVSAGAVYVLTALAVTLAGAVSVAITVPVGFVPFARIVTVGAALFLRLIPTDETV